MSALQRVGSIDIDHDVRYQEREWRVHRVAWAFIAIFVVAAVLGVFGTGPVSWTEVSADDGDLAVDLQRFSRRSAGNDLTITVAPRLAENGTFQVDIDRDFVLGLEIEGIQPTPDSVEVVDGAFRYTFAQGAPGAALQVLVSYRSEALWDSEGSVSIPGGPAVDFWTFTYF